jgi:hypothetical protein
MGHALRLRLDVAYSHDLTGGILHVGMPKGKPEEATPVVGCLYFDVANRVRRRDASALILSSESLTYSDPGLTVQPHLRIVLFRLPVYVITDVPQKACLALK